MINKLVTICISVCFLTGCSIYEPHQVNIYNPERITKKHFGTYVTPQNSPVQPEVFTGWHTALDFETFPEEANEPVPVYAICNGPLITNKWAQGYGGVIVQSCEINQNPVTIIYGHIKLSSVPTDKTTFAFGDQLAILGDGYSHETDNERKHLHLGIHKGTDINLLGYVQTQAELDDWMNPWEVLSLNFPVGND